VVEDESTITEYATDLANVLTFELVPNFRSVGPRLGSVRAGRPRATRRRGRDTRIGWSDQRDALVGTFALNSDDIELRVKDKSYAVSRDGRGIASTDADRDELSVSSATSFARCRLRKTPGSTSPIASCFTSRVSTTRRRIRDVGE